MYFIFIFSVFDPKYGDYTGVELTIRIKRNPTFYNLVIVKPAVMLSVMTIFMFLMPPSAVDRYTYGKPSRIIQIFTSLLFPRLNVQHVWHRDVSLWHIRAWAGLQYLSHKPQASLFSMKCHTFSEMLCKMSNSPLRLCAMKVQLLKVFKSTVQWLLISYLSYLLTVASD